MRNKRVVSFLHNLFLFVALCGLVCSLYRASDCFVFTLSGASLLLLTIFIPDNKKGGLWVRLVILGAAAVAIIIMREWIMTGVQLFANDIYDVAEEAQGYIYDRYDVNVDEAGYHFYRMITAILLSVIGAAAVSFVTSQKVRALVVLSVFGFIVFLHAYYGIKPDILWMMIFTAMMIVTLSDVFIRGGRTFFQGSGLLLGCAAIIVALTFLIAPNDSARVSELNEQLRDRFSLRTAFITNNNNSGESDDGEGAEKEKNDEKDLKDKNDGGENGSRVNLLQIVVILVISAAAVVLTVLFIWKRSILERKRKKNRKGIDSPDNTEAVHSMFIYLMRWLTAAGISKENAPFSDCVGALNDAMPEGYSSEYKTWFKMWQEATFGNKKFSDEQRDLMKSFMDRTSKYLWSKATFKEKYDYKYKFAL